MTSSANSVRFFTVFQCGMSATCMTQLMWLVFIAAAQSPIWLATFSGVPTAMKKDSLMRLEVEAAMHLVGHGGADLELLDRQVAGRRQILRRSCADNPRRSAARCAMYSCSALLLRFRDVDEGQQRQLIGPDGVAVMRGALAQSLVELLRALPG